MVERPDGSAGGRTGPSGREAALRAARRQARERAVRRRRAVAAALVFAAIALTIFIATIRVSDIPENVSIAGVDVSGMDYEAAHAALVPVMDTQLGKIVEFRSDTAPDLAIDLPARTVVSGADFASAFEAARTSRGRFGRMLSRFGIAPHREVPLTYNVRPSAVTTVAREAEADLGTHAVSASVVMQDSRIAIRPSREGRRVDRTELLRRISLLPDTVDVPVRVEKPVVTTDTAQRAAALAERIRAETRTVTYRQRTASLTPAVMTEALTFTNRGPEIVVGFAPGPVRAALVKPLGIAERPPRDARWRLAGARATIIPAQKGRRLNVGALAAALRADHHRQTLEAKIRVSQPRRTTADAKKLRITERISSFTTPYDCCQNRVVNIGQAARILDSTIIRPGATYSLNDALGERTTARGFVEAPAIEGGELKPSIGGGVSQVATTMYNAAFFAGLDIVSHQPHSFYFPRYPRGREATISWREPDLVFRNDWDAAILLSVATSSNAITVSMYSSKLGRRVETTSGEPTNIVEPKTIERLKPDLEPGTENTIQSMGQPGFSISYTRRVYRNDQVVSDRTFYWTYKPENEIIEKGPPKPEPDPTTSTGTTTTRTSTTRGSTGTTSTGTTTTGPTATP